MLFKYGERLIDEIHDSILEYSRLLCFTTVIHGITFEFGSFDVLCPSTWLPFWFSYCFIVTSTVNSRVKTLKVTSTLE